MDRRLLARVALACTLAGFAAGCARGDEPAGAVVTPTPTPAPAQSDFFSGGECPAATDPGLPEGAGCVTSASDGPARLLVYALLGRDSMPRTWRVRLTDGARELDQKLRQSNVWSYPRALGATDLNRDGRREWWIKVAGYGSHGAAWGGLDLFVVERDALVPVVFEGAPLTVDFGGISRLGQGAKCRHGDLFLLRVWARDRQNTTWWVSERRLDLDGRRARFLGRRRDSITIDDYTDPDLMRNYRVECDGETFTPFD